MSRGPAPIGAVVRFAGALALACCVAGCGAAESGAVSHGRSPRPAAEPPAAPARADRPTPSRIDRLLAAMTLDEKLGQLTQQAGAFDGPAGPRIEPADRALIARGGVGSFLSIYGARFTRELQTEAVEHSRLHIPLLFAFDVIHGFRTTFPVPLAEASSWDPAAVQAAARVAADEATASGLHWTFAPMVDVARDARWGRIVEGAGEDPYLGSVMAAARVRGFQGTDLGARDTLLACAKHMAAYGAVEAGREYNTVDISERTLRDVYLPPFRAAVDAGAVTLMSAFNEIGGVPSSASPLLLTQILRREWGFGGFVVSDWKSVGQLIDHGVAADRAQAGRLALTAGVDMDMVSHIYGGELRAEVEAGRVPMAAVDAAVRRVLEAKERLGLFDDPYRYSDPAREKAEILSPAHRAAARAMARESIVLLENRGGLLPLDPAALRRVAVIGPLAESHQAPLGPWSVPGRAEDVVSVLDGLRRALPARVKIVTAPGTTGVEAAAGAGGEARDRAAIRAAAALARRADAVILVVGESDTMSGEAKSRAHIDLPGRQGELARAVIAANPRTAVVLMNGRPLAIPWLAAHAPALVESWFLGVETGNALADVLLGAAAPVGKLPVSFPRASGEEPLHYDHKNTGRPAASDVVWSSKYIDVAIPPLYPFGYGLSYTRFAYRDLSVTPDAPGPDGTVTVRFTVKNVGRRAGVEVAELYLRDPVASVTRPVEQLKGFARVALRPGQARRVSIAVPVRMLAFHGADMKLGVEPGAIQVMVGSSSADIRLRGGFTVRGPRRLLPDDHAVYSRATVE